MISFLFRKHSVFTVFLVFCLSLFIHGFIFAQKSISVDITNFNNRSQKHSLVDRHTNILVHIELPAEKRRFFLHKIPKKLIVNMNSTNFPDECKVLKRKQTPFLLFCKNISTPLDIKYTGEWDTSSILKKSSGFTAGKYFSETGERVRFFQNISFLFAPEQKEGSVSALKNEEKKALPKENMASILQKKEEGNIFQKKENDIPLHLQTQKNPKSNIILDESKDVFVASYDFAPQNEPLTVKELTVEIQNVDTSPLYTDVLRDFEMIESVSLWYQDGSPVLQKDGSFSRSLSISSSGKSLLRNLNLTIPENGERIFIAVSVRKMLDGKSGSAFRARFSQLSADHDIRGFWSKNPVLSNFSGGASPVQYILSNKLTLTKQNDQIKTLSLGRNDLLKYKAEVRGGDDLFVQKLGVTLSKTGDSFWVKKLLLRVDGDLVASISGSDITGKQIFIVGECAAGDICHENTNEKKHALFDSSIFVIEAEVEGTLEHGNVLYARTQINGSSPGSDDILWEDAGTQNRSGVSLQWINNTENRSENRIENTLSAP